MNVFRNLSLAALLVTVLALGPVAAAQVSVGDQEGLVNVDISNVRTEIAKDINVDVSQIPVTVQVPVAVAANVCGVDVSVLTSQLQQGNASCTAKSASSALNSVVQDQIKEQK